MQLWQGNRAIGRLTDYHYETPTALARLEGDPALIARLVRASHFLNVVLAADADDALDDDAVWAATLAELGLTEAVLAEFKGPWRVVSDRSGEPEGPIQLIECDAEGWIGWRWSPT